MASGATAVAIPPTGETISLYFTLKAGEKADLEVVALAALQWLDAMRAAAREIEPSAQIRVELVDADEGSLRLNTILDWAEAQLSRIQEGTGRYPRLWRLAISLAIFVPTVGYPTYDFYFGEKPSSLSAADRKLLEENKHLLNELLEKTRKSPEVGAKRQSFFKTLERDPSITGAGIIEGRKASPLLLIPSSQFAEEGGLFAIAEEEPGEHTIHPIVDVVLVSPVLRPTPRSWRFQPEGLPEFTAVMRDKRFLQALEHDHVKESLRTGIRMTLRLEVKEKKVDGAWTVKRRGRSVVEVISPKVT